MMEKILFLIQTSKKLINLIDLPHKILKNKISPNSEKN